MKRLFALVALVFGLVACQTEPENLGVNLGDSVETVVNITLPEGTRGSADTSFDNGVLDDHKLRYIMEVYLYDEQENTYTKSTQTYETLADDANKISIPVRLVPNRTYRFVVWADFVANTTTIEDEDKDLYYYTSAGLKNIRVITEKWNIVDEARDAFSGFEQTVFTGTAGINVKLTRPFAKLRAMTNDLDIIKALGLQVGDIEVAYTTPVCTGFDAFNGEANNKISLDKVFTYTFNDEDYGEANADVVTLFTDFIFAKSETVRFTMTVKDTTTAKKAINSLNFNTDIPLQRNTITTIKGSLLTNGNDISIEIEQGYNENEKEWPSSIEEQLAYVAIVGGKVTLTEDIDLTETSSNLVFVADAVINLNGHTLTAGKPDSAEMTGTDIAAITVDNGATLTIYGNTNEITTFAANNTEGSIIGSEYGVYVKNGTANIVSGNISAGTSAVQVNKGTANISGGKFSATGSDKRYVINCIDARWKDKTAKVNITGGTFENFNPGNNAAEGANTNFVASGYKSQLVEGSTTDYEVVDASTLVTNEKLNDILTSLKNTDETEIILKLAEDVTPEKTIDVPAGKDVHLNLNGQTITIDPETLTPNGNGSHYAFIIREGGTLTIDGNGTVEATTPAPIMFYPAGNLVIENGTFIRNIPEGYTGSVGSMFVGTKPAGGWHSTGVTINGGYFDCGYYPAVLKTVDVEKLITGDETLTETEDDIAKRGQAGDTNVIRKALKDLVSKAFNSSNNYFLVYGGTFVGASPAWGDEGGMLPRTPNFLQPWSYYQGAFLKGQSISAELGYIGVPALPDLPEGYTITKGTHEDGRPTYTVTYSK